MSEGRGRRNDRAAEGRAPRDGERRPEGENRNGEGRNTEGREGREGRNGRDGRGRRDAEGGSTSAALNGEPTAAPAEALANVNANGSDTGAAPTRGERGPRRERGERGDRAEGGRRERGERAPRNAEGQERITS